MTPDRDRFLGALVDPTRVTAWSLAEWDRMVRVARKSGLAARLYHLLLERGVLEQIPPRPVLHLSSVATVADRQHVMLAWEVEQVRQALAPQGTRVILLKGGAYVMAGLPVARGRLFSDIDILVPHDVLKETEQALFAFGWLCQGYDAYDRRYYRQWMHELPPLTHISRKSVLDVHHTILPPTARLRPDPRRLMEAAVPVEHHKGVFVLCPEDMVLHSATHLFHDGELEHGLRDLADLDDLLRHFAQRDGFWDRLVARGYEMDLARPLFYALRYCRALLETPVPPEVMASLERAGPPSYLRAVLDRLFERGLSPHHPLCDDRFSSLARWLLYVRSHYLRMPMHLLLPHLVRKAFKKNRSTAG
ncbi:nucleotidyltransferase family protein [Ectothiorhodospira variabilis]|uniref:nucleotidyltransferase domain-containing protein n=1 Tax=Ectothiorhodospira variabilis TaxID=505694 RepID=UPI001EFBD2FE|nr:nucleotidyltransferase family protein [Ectothiorhodospira variabilis]MCG5497518.1 nucleotidyltransferase family protein [Ectothiorhodospira variabilis]